MATRRQGFIEGCLYRRPRRCRQILYLVSGSAISCLNRRLRVSRGYVPVGRTSFSSVTCSTTTFTPRRGGLFVPGRGSGRSGEGKLCSELDEVDGRLSSVL